MQMTTQQENAILTQVGRSTPMGELLRRYWWPVGISAHLKDKPTFIRVMGRGLGAVPGTARVGQALLGAYCAHRRANLCLGDVETGGLRCRYHGWLYDTEGRVLQTPASRRRASSRTVSASLPIRWRSWGGLCSRISGPSPHRFCPGTTFSSATGSSTSRCRASRTATGCSAWRTASIRCIRVSPTAGAWPDIRSSEPDMGFEETQWGLVYKAYRKSDKPGEFNYREHHLLMPGISCGGSGGRYLKGASGGTPVSAARWSVPIDDTHTLLMRVRFKPADNPGKYEGDPFSARWKPPENFIEPYKEYRESDNPVLGYDIRRFTSSRTAWWWTAWARGWTGRRRTSRPPSTTASSVAQYVLGGDGRT